MKAEIHLLLSYFHCTLNILRTVFLCFMCSFPYSSIFCKAATCSGRRICSASKCTNKLGDILRKEVIARKNGSSSTALVHPTAIVHPEATIHEDVVIGPFCTVGPSIKLGKGCMLHPNSHVFGETELGEGCILHSGAIVGADIPGRTILGKENVIGHHAVIGLKCQDLKYKEGDDCHLHIGNKNDIREFVSIHRSSNSNDLTTIGNRNLIMGACHIAHDCKVGDDNVLANGSLLGGHVIVQDYVHIGGGVAVHQRCQIDSYAFLAGGSMVVRDVPMYVMVSGNRAGLCGLNVEGLRRHNFCHDEVSKIKKAYQKLFMNMEGKLEDRLSILASSQEMVNVQAVAQMLNSVKGCLGENRRGICNFGRWKS